MKVIKFKSNREDISFSEVAAVADRMVWTGKVPTVNAICEDLNTDRIDRVRQCFALWKAGYNHIQARKTHIADLPPELQHMLNESFESQISALKARLEAECEELRRERDRLAKINEQKDAQIMALTLALGDAEVKIADQVRRISRLKNEAAGECGARAKTEERRPAEPDQGRSQA